MSEQNGLMTKWKEDMAAIKTQVWKRTIEIQDRLDKARDLLSKASINETDAKHIDIELRCATDAALFLKGYSQ